jgi:benzodiazapine receptor
MKIMKDKFGFTVRSPVILAFSILICLAAGFLGSLVTMTGPGSWYYQLAKPWFNPPSFIFGPVWTALYILMGISLYLVLVEGLEKPLVKLAAGLFAVQLVLNAVWSYAFFGLESPFLGFVELMILWIFILATIIAFFKTKRIAAFLMLPYIAWVTFAGCLTYTIMILNP